LSYCTIYACFTLDLLALTFELIYTVAFLDLALETYSVKSVRRVETPGLSTAPPAAPRQSATAARLLCTLPGAAQRRLGVGWRFVRRNHYIRCLGKTVIGDDTLGKSMVGDPRAHIAAWCAPALALPQGLGRFVRGEATSLRSWQEGPAVRWHDGRNFQSSIPEQLQWGFHCLHLAAGWTPLCVHGDEVERRAPGWRNRAHGSPGRLGSVPCYLCLQGTKSLTHSTLGCSGECASLLAMLDLPYCEAGWRQLCKGFGWNKSPCPSLTFVLGAQCQRPKEALAGSALAGPQHGEVWPHLRRQQLALPLPQRH